MANVNITSDEISTSEYSGNLIRTIKADFGIRDEKGRAVGGMAWVMAHDGQYTVRVQATRDGEKYGALTPSRIFSDSFAVQDFYMKRFADQAKSYAKKYAQVAL